ncbi:MAG TPA: hypothetical protein VJP76_07350, partial [Candidatus Tumulicola sp.]|nr:hypothetical protein [Candidatus Tumulicola sp.]
MGARQSGFTLLETCVALGIAALLLLAGGIWVLGARPGSLARTVNDYDAALAAARAIAVSGTGATIVFAPRTPHGFTLRVYRGRPSPGSEVLASPVMPSTSDAAVAERSLHAPPFSIFLGASGHVSALAGYPRFDARGDATFPTVPTEPPCPDGGIALRFSEDRGAAATRILPCAASPLPGPRMPNPSPTPNTPSIAPPVLVYHWPADATQTLTVTEWGYTHWFATVDGFACGDAVALYPDILPSPFSQPYDRAEGDASPSPPPSRPFSYPNSHGRSMND